MVSNARVAGSTTTSLGIWDSFDWNAIPRDSGARLRGSLEGWVYVVGFDLGVVKVGQSIQPRNRIKQHIKDAMRFGGTVTEFWLSPQHPTWNANEVALIRWCANRGRQTFGEYFADVQYEDVVTYAQTLTYRLPNPYQPIDLTHDQPSGPEQTQVTTGVNWFEDQNVINLDRRRRGA